jgi:hypothetical protein
MTNTTPTPSITREQAALIAQLLRTIRPAWDAAATGKYVAEASREHRDLADLVHGCIRTVQDTALTSPASLTFSGPQWTRSVRTVESSEERAARIQAQIDAREERERGYSLSEVQRNRAEEAKKKIRDALVSRHAHRQHTPEEKTA